MIYSSTVTSKGTITLPAGIRAKLGIISGKEVSIELRGDTIAIKPKAGWEQVLQAGENLRSDLRRRGVKLPINFTTLAQDTEAVKKKAYKSNFLGK